MRMSQKQLQSLLSKNSSLKCREIKLPKSKSIPSVKDDFDSEAERNYYYNYLYPLILAKEIKSVEIHKSFEILSAISYSGKKLKARVYTPDFVIHYPNGAIKVVEIKGKAIKKLQRDYPLRKHLFIQKYVIPNEWEFEEVEAEGVVK